MKIGDLVKFVGYPQHRCEKSCDQLEIGIVVGVWVSTLNNEKRFDVVWGNEAYGRGLFRETLEIIC